MHQHQPTLLILLMALPASAPLPFTPNPVERPMRRAELAARTPAAGR